MTVYENVNHSSGERDIMGCVSYPFPAITPDRNDPVEDSFCKGPRFWASVRQSIIVSGTCGRGTLPWRTGSRESQQEQGKIQLPGKLSCSAHPHLQSFTSTMSWVPGGGNLSIRSDLSVSSVYENGLSGTPRSVLLNLLGAS